MSAPESMVAPASGLVPMPLLGRWWTRSLIAIATTVLWFVAASCLGRVGHFARNRDTTDADVALWLAVGAIGLGLYAALALIRVNSDRYLLPGWAFAIPGLFSAASYLFIVTFDREQPSPEVWAPYIWYPITLCVIALAMAHRRLPRLRVALGIVAIAVAVLPWPIWLVVLIQRGCC